MANDVVNAISSDITVSNKAELLSALANASGGEVIALQSGNYGDIDINSVSFSDYVTIRSADENARAQFNTIDISNSEYIRVDNVHVNSNSDGVSAQGFVNVIASSHVDIINSEINGTVDSRYTVDTSQYSDGYGIEVSGDSSNINVSQNYIHDSGHGAVFLGVDDLIVSGNTINDIGSDSFKFSGIVNGLIENNTGAAFVHPDPNDHVDFIQFQGDGTNITLRGNILLPGDEGISDLDGKVYQGIFLKDGVFTDVMIEQNLIYTNTVNAIFVQSDSGTGGNVTIRNNTTLSPPDITKWNSADISVISLAGNYTIENNITDNITNTAGNGGSVHDNIEVQFSNPSAANYYNNFYVNATAGAGASIEDFAIVSGAASETAGAYQRISELVDGTTTNTAPTATDDYLTLDEDTSAAINALANDKDGDGDMISVTGFTQPEHGSVTHNGQGTFTYTADPDFFGDDSFRYTITDGDLSAAATVNITVDDVQEPGGDLIPSDIGGLALWLDASDSSSVIADAQHPDAVDTWRDLSGHGNDADQTSDTLQPHLAPGGIGGRASLAFDGVDDLLKISDSKDLNTGESYDGKTLMMVFETSDDVTGRQVLYEEGAGTRGLNMYLDGGRIYFNGWNQAETAWGPSSVSTAVQSNTVYQVTLSLDGAGGVLTGSMNGKVVGSVDDVGVLYRHGGDIGIGAVNKGTLFHDGTTSKSGQHFNGEIGEMVFFDHALDNDEQTTVEQYLADKWLTDQPTPIFSSGPHTFDGTTGSAVVVPHDPQYELAEGTIAMTFAADELAGLQGLLTKDAYGYGSGGHIGVYLSGDDIRVRMQSTGNETDLLLDTAVTADEDHDLAVTFGSGGLDVYLDGVHVGGDDSWTYGLTGNTEPLVLGANQWASTAETTNALQDAFDGTIDVVSIYSQAFSEAEIGQIF